jgi:tRNA(adenine34) deaminase
MMSLAIEMAKLGETNGEVPIGAVIVCDGEIIAKAHNLKETLADPTAHAEMLVIREAAQKLGRWRLDDCQLYVTAEPCVMCMGAIIQARIPMLVYGVAEKKFGGVESTAFLGQHPMLPKQMEIYAGICEDACEKLLACFFQNIRADKNG